MTLQISHVWDEGMTYNFPLVYFQKLSAFFINKIAVKAFFFPLGD